MACLVSCTDVGGGAARASWRLFEGLRVGGHPVKMVVERKTVDDADVLECRHEMDFGARLYRKLRRELTAWEMRRSPGPHGSQYEIFTPARSPHGARIAAAIPECDLVNLHWVAGFVDEDGVREVLKRWPVVWTLHDQHALTGGCHFDEECGRFRTACRACPQLGSASGCDAASRGWERRRRAFDQIDVDSLVFVTPSRWLADCVAASPFAGRFRVDVIEYGLDLDEFAPRNPQVARTVLGLGEAERVICFAAGGIGGRRKGFDVLRAALARIPRERRPTVLFVGTLPRGHGLDSRVVSPGPISINRLLSLFYSAADLTVVPSYQDNLPNVILESFACGTPVVGARAGGIPEAIEEGRTGRLFMPGDADELAKVLDDTLNAGKLAINKMGGFARRKAEQEYGAVRQAERYTNLFREVCG